MGEVGKGIDKTRFAKMLINFHLTAEYMQFDNTLLFTFVFKIFCNQKLF